MDQIEAPAVLAALNGRDTVRDEIYKSLYYGVGYINVAAVAGNVAEFGTSSGRTAMTLAKAMADFEASFADSRKAHGIAPRRLYLFDSFEGLPAPTSTIDAEMPHITAGVWAYGVAKGVGPDVLKRMCATYLAEADISIHRGWYRDSLPALPAGVKFAMVHIDCDYYESTMDVLTRLFEIDAFSDGCAIYFDDWYCNRGSPDFGEQRAWQDCVGRYRPRFSDWGTYATVGRRFIIHKS